MYNRPSWQQRRMLIIKFWAKVDWRTCYVDRVCPFSPSRLWGIKRQDDRQGEIQSVKVAECQTDRQIDREKYKVIMQSPSVIRLATDWYSCSCVFSKFKIWFKHFNENRQCTLMPEHTAKAYNSIPPSFVIRTSGYITIDKQPHECNLSINISGLAS